MSASPRCVRTTGVRSGRLGMTSSRVSAGTTCTCARCGSGCVSTRCIRVMPARLDRLGRAAAPLGLEGRGASRNRQACARADPPRLADVSRARRPGPRRVRGPARARARRSGATRSSGPSSTLAPAASAGTPALAARTLRTARSFKPDVVYAHFLVPSGLIAALASRAPLVVTAHGRDVRNVGAIPGIGSLTRLTIRRAAAVIAVSDYLRRELETKVPEARGKTEVIDSGVDLERFRVEPAPDGGPHFLCLGALSARKNVVRLARGLRTARLWLAHLRRRRHAPRRARRPARSRGRRRASRTTRCLPGSRGRTSSASQA